MLGPWRGLRGRYANVLVLEAVLILLFGLLAEELTWRHRELVFVAERRMMRSVLRGDAGAALRWSRVRDLMEAGEAEIQRLMAQDDAIAFDRAGHAELAAMGAEDAG